MYVCLDINGRPKRGFEGSRGRLIKLSVVSFNVTISLLPDSLALLFLLLSLDSLLLLPVGTVTGRGCVFFLAVRTVGDCVQASPECSWDPQLAHEADLVQLTLVVFIQ